MSSFLKKNFITLPELVQKIESGEFTIREQNLFPFTENIKQKVIDVLNRLIDKINEYRQSHPEPRDSIHELMCSDQVSLLDDGTLDCFAEMGRFRVHSSSYSFEVGLGMSSENEIAFYKFDKIDGKYKYVLADVDAEVLKEVVYEIQVPSKVLSFANYFCPETINPIDDELKHEDEYSLNGIIGRRNRALYYAEKNNVGYGQTGNTSVNIYFNGKEIIITEMWVEDPEGYDLDCDELTKYIQGNNFKLMGAVCCDVWRWECTDSEKAKPWFEANPRVDHVEVPIDGTKIKIINYGHTVTESPLGDCVFAHMYVL